RAGEFSTGGNTHLKRVHAHIDRFAALDVAVRQVGLHKLELEREALYHFAKIVTSAFERETKASKLAFDPRHAGEYLRESAELGLLRAQPQRKLGGGFERIDVELTGQCNVRDTRAHRGLQLAVVQ